MKRPHVYIVCICIALLCVAADYYTRANALRAVSFGRHSALDGMLADDSALANTYYASPRSLRQIVKQTNALGLAIYGEDVLAIDIIDRHAGSLVRDVSPAGQHPVWFAAKIGVREATFNRVVDYCDKHALLLDDKYAIALLSRSQYELIYRIAMRSRILADGILESCNSWPSSHHHVPHIQNAISRAERDRMR
jgi:hypothetical protein